MLSNFLDAIPFVDSDADRDARFPAPQKNLRVQYADGSIKRYTGAAWVLLESAIAKVSSVYLTGDSVADDRGALDTLVNVTMQPNGGELDIVGVPRIASNLTIPKNIQLRFRNGAYIAPDIGATVTILGTFDKKQVKKFGGGGVITLAGNHRMSATSPFWWGAVGDGVADDTNPIVSADVAAATVGGTVDFPVATYKTTANLLPTANWRGTRWASIIQPSAAVTKCIDLKGFDLKGLTLDGVNTNGKTGIDAGTTSLISNFIVRDVRVHNFLGVGAKGIKFAQAVTGRFENVYTDNNYINCHCAGGNTPTNSVFDNCQFRTATTKGVWFETGYFVEFRNCLWESNGEEGFYMQNVGGTAIGILISGTSWFENNWNSIALGAGRHVKYALFVDGANGPAGTIQLTIENAYFSGGATTARSIHLTNAVDYVIDHTKVFNEAANIVVDGTSFGKFENWAQQNGPIFTTVSAVAGSAWSTRSEVEDVIYGPGIDYVPTVVGSSGTMTITALVIQEARYWRLGKHVFVSLQMTFTTGGVGNLAVHVSAPVNFRSRNALRYETAYITDGAYTDGYMRGGGENPTSTIRFGRKDNAIWTLGAARGINAIYVMELF